MQYRKKTKVLIKGEQRVLEINGSWAWKKGCSGIQKCTFLGGIVGCYGIGLEAPLRPSTLFFYGLSINTPL